jgi:hypothetical protein
LVTWPFDFRDAFLGRKCCKLKCESQYESEEFRRVRKAQKIRLMLHGSPNMFTPFPPKPRHMHFRTYQKLRKKAGESERSALELRDQYYGK